MRKFSLYALLFIVSFFVLINIGIKIFGPLDRETRNTNKSFGSATELYTGYNVSFTQTVDETLYFKFSTTDLNYMRIYTTGNVDTTLKLYNSSYTFQSLTENPDANSMNYTIKPNFALDFYAQGHTEYYFIVTVNEPGTYTLHFNYGNFFWSKDISALLSGYNSVNSKDEIRYKFEDTTYKKEFEEAAAKWNELGKVKILPSKNNDDVTLLIQVESDDTKNMWSWYFPNSSPTVLVINTYKIEHDNFSDVEKVNLCMHEIGHTLGMGDFNKDDNNELITNIMMQGRISNDKLGPADIAVYRFLWGY